MVATFPTGPPSAAGLDGQSEMRQGSGVWLQIHGGAPDRRVGFISAERRLPSHGRGQGYIDRTQLSGSVE